MNNDNECDGTLGNYHHIKQDYDHHIKYDTCLSLRDDLSNCRD